MQEVDVLIVGAGPAGSTLSHFLQKAKVDHLLIDKASFPRDKVCGDGITVDVLSNLKKISPELLDRYSQDQDMLPSWGFCFHGPQGQEYRVDLRDKGLKYPPFFTAKRNDFDNFLLKTLPNPEHFLPNCALKGLEREAGNIIARVEHLGQEKEYRCKFVIGAEGEKPVVSRFLGLKHYRKKEHLIGALRVYYKGLKNFHPNQHLEFFFDKEILPGYFWAFPLKNGEANVGLGLVSPEISKRKVNLKKALDQIIAKNPKIAAMFEEAEPLEKPQGWGLPTISTARDIAGENYALIGDAAGMIDPFTGKGIGPGMTSGRLVSEAIINCLEDGSTNLQAYQEHIYRYYKGEMRISYALQKNLKQAWLFKPLIGVLNFGPLLKYAEDRMVSDFNRWT